MTDLVHLQSSGEINILFDTVMMLSFIFNGLIMGFLSIYLVHRQLLKRLTIRWAHTIINVVIIVCSFAIYLGRSLRWNSWDVLVNPAGLLYDVSDRLVHPITYPEAILTTVTFSLLIGVMYLFVYQIASLIFAKTDQVSKRHIH